LQEAAYYISSQLFAYRDCLAKYGARHDWVAFVDVDEFIVLRDPKYKYDLPGFLSRYREYGALGVQWRVVGSSGHNEPPKVGVRAGYTHCLPEGNSFSRTVKMIVQPKFTSDIIVRVCGLPRGCDCCQFATQRPA
jgi:hypothetical protein